MVVYALDAFLDILFENFDIKMTLVFEAILFYFIFLRR